VADAKSNRVEERARSGWLTCGEAAIAPTALALGAILLATVFAAAWWIYSTPHLTGRRAINWDAFNGVGAIGAIGLLFLWVVYRRLRSRLSAVLAVYDALSAAASDQLDPTWLEINPDLGPEAQAWNRLVSEVTHVRREAVGERTRQRLNAPGDGQSEIGAACDVMPQGLIVVDPHCRITYANGAAASFLGCKRDEMLDADLISLVKFQVIVDALADSVASNHRKRRIIDVERQGENSTGYLRFIIRPVRRDDSGSAMVIIEDITQQRCAEESRHKFVAQATHELRTPLTNIRLYVESAIEEGEKDPAARARCLNIINSESRRLERIVGEMLSVAEIEAGSLKLKDDAIKAESLFDDLKSDYEQAAKEKQITLTFELSPKLPVIRGDRDKILMALHNLVGNAVKYTPNGKTVSIVADASDKQLSVKVRDTGIGISESDAERIFERFYRAQDPRVSRITGSGIGLTLAREVIRLHGGDITVNSRLNEGSVFTLTLPVKGGN